MATEILMPALSPTMEEGTLAKWLVKEGDTVSSGDIIAEIETDKATMEFEAVDEGVIGRILVAEGTEAVKVNTPIAVIGKKAKTCPGRRHRTARRRAGSFSPRSFGKHRRNPGSCPRRTRSQPGLSRRHRNGGNHRARSLARCHGRGNARRRNRLRHGRGSCRVPGRLQDHPRSVGRIRRPPGHRHPDHRTRLCRCRRWRKLGWAETDC